MFIHKVIETSEGTVEFKGEFSQEEVSFLIEYSLNQLLQKKLIPFVVKEPEAASQVGPGTDQVQ